MFYRVKGKHWLLLAWPNWSRVSETVISVSNELNSIILTSTVSKLRTTKCPLQWLSFLSQRLLVVSWIFVRETKMTHSCVTLPQATTKAPSACISALNWVQKIEIPFNCTRTSASRLWEELLSKKSKMLPTLQLDMLHYRGFQNNVRLKPNQFQETGLRSCMKTNDIWMTAKSKQNHIVQLIACVTC